MILDCSGSMDGPHIEAARILVRSLSLLAAEGAIEGHLILSAIEGSTARSERFAWPVPIEVIRRIHAYGDGEGLRDAIQAHLAEIRRAEKLYVFTDGRIHERDLNLAGLRRSGIDVIGLFVGDADAARAALARHFERFAARTTLAGLIDFLLLHG